MKQSYQDYEDTFNENQIKLAGKFTKHPKESYLSKETLLMFCSEYAEEIAGEFIKLCPDFLEINNISLKVYSQRCSCEHCGKSRQPFCSNQKTFVESYK